jgi:hypothetical protein
MPCLYILPVCLLYFSFILPSPFKSLVHSPSARSKILISVDNALTMTMFYDAFYLEILKSAPDYQNFLL